MGHERPPRRRARVAAIGLADIGDQRPAARAGDAKPGAAGFEVAAGQEALGPPRGRGRRSDVMLVSVGGDDDREPGVRAVRDQREAH